MPNASTIFMLAVFDLSRIYHAAVENALNQAEAIRMATRQKPNAISLFSTARDRPAPLAESSQSVWLARVS
jgi:hypothetical protein